MSHLEGRILENRGFNQITLLRIFCHHYNLHFNNNICSPTSWSNNIFPLGKIISVSCIIKEWHCILSLTAQKSRGEP